jgi:hypothetical protein
LSDRVEEDARRFRLDIEAERETGHICLYKYLAVASGLFFGILAVSALLTNPPQVVRMNISVTSMTLAALLLFGHNPVPACRCSFANRWMK